MIRRMEQATRRWWWLRSLPPRAREQRRRYASGAAIEDPGTDAVLEAAADWLCTAQDHSSTRDGGVSRHFSLITGWGASYPETTGYIVPTMLRLAQELKRPDLRDRARRMLDWLVEIQMPEGGFQGGMVNSVPKKPGAFNTGQILIGLAAGVTEFDAPAYRHAMRLAADWLVDMQDPDGCWRRAPSPFAAAGEKAYDTHVARGLLEAVRVQSVPRWEEAAFRNVRWAIGKQAPNGWVHDCCLSDPAAPLTHTLGYFLRGLLEGVQFRHDDAVLTAAERLGHGLRSTQRSDGALPGQLRSDWRAAVSWVCLTGGAEIAECWFDLYRWTNDREFLDAASRAIRYVRRTIAVTGPPEIRGGVKGSFPVDGEYGAFEYLNWACKFTVDTCLREREIRASASGGLSTSASA